MTTTIGSTNEQQAAEFTSAVREHLADLPSEELDELLDGLQADLVERLTEGDALGDSKLYADELRLAAGFPERGSAPAEGKIPFRERIRDRNASLGRRVRAFWHATPARRAILEFLVSLKPVWWVARGVVITWVLMLLVGYPRFDVSLPTILLATGLVVVSVQWGRGLWAPKAWLVGLRRAASVVALVFVLPLFGTVLNTLVAPSYVDTPMPEPQGLSANGLAISNIFAFDCQGQPVEGVQLFDQDGKPLTTLLGEPGVGVEPMYGFDEETQQHIVYERHSLAGYAGLWNVFPLREARADLDRNPDDARVKDATWPVQDVVPLSPSCPTDEAEAPAEPSTP